VSRPLRIEYAGAHYHIMNRGNRKRIVFNNDLDYKLFLDRLVYFSEIYEIDILSYCLMPSHFHLYLKTNHPNLSRFMQSFMTSFTVIKNRNEDTYGHIFGMFHISPYLLYTFMYIGTIK